jgi:hypothetical protein
MISHQILLAVILFILGGTAKLADLYNEHGLAEPFKGASYLSGVIWGLCGVIVMLISPLAGLTYIAHVLYWFRRIKLEYSNHALAGVMIVLGGYYLQGEFLYSHRNDLIGVYLAYLLTGYVHSYFKNNYPSTRKFLRLRLRIYLVPLCYSLYQCSLDPIMATIFGMVGCELVTYLYREYAYDPREAALMK